VHVDGMFAPNRHTLSSGISPPSTFAAARVRLPIRDGNPRRAERLASSSYQELPTRRALRWTSTDAYVLAGDAGNGRRRRCCASTAPEDQTCEDAGCRGAWRATLQGAVNDCRITKTGTGKYGAGRMRQCRSKRSVTERPAIGAWYPVVVARSESFRRRPARPLSSTRTTMAGTEFDLTIGPALKSPTTIRRALSASRTGVQQMADDVAWMSLSSDHRA